MLYLGVDWGEKRIGLSFGDDETRMASPYGVVVSLRKILSVIKLERVDAIVVGAPHKMSGLKAELGKEYKIFLTKLKASVDLPVLSIDERLTSKAADALIGDKKVKAPRDAIAAMLILQAYFDRIK